VINWRNLLKEWKEVKEKEKKSKIVALKKEELLREMKEEISKIWEKAKEPFFARFVIGSQKKMMTGLVKEWRIDKEEMIVVLIQEKLEREKVIQKKRKN